MNKTTIYIIIAVIALIVLPRLFGALFNIIGIAVVVGLLVVLFNPKLRKRLTKLLKLYNRTRRK